MTGLTHHFDRLNHEQRLFWMRMAGASPDNARHSSIAIDAWHREHGMARDRAVAEFMAWLQIARESIGVEGVGHA
jgi:hypothetical protein